MMHLHGRKALVRGSARVLCGAFILASAWAAAPSPSGIASCPRITDDKQRLACFDREFALQKQATRAPEARRTPVPAPKTAAPAPETSTPAARTELTPEQRMGLTPGRILKLQGSQESRDLKELTAKIRSVSGDPRARRAFILENGQVWRQVEPDSQFAVQPGDTVRISKALFGSYFMSVNRHMSTRVTRAR